MSALSDSDTAATGWAPDRALSVTLILNRLALVAEPLVPLEKLARLGQLLITIRNTHNTYGVTLFRKQPDKKFHILRSFLSRR